MPSKSDKVSRIKMKFNTITSHWTQYLTLDLRPLLVNTFHDLLFCTVPLLRQRLLESSIELQFTSLPLFLNSSVDLLLIRLDSIRYDDIRQDIFS